MCGGLNVPVEQGRHFLAHVREQMRLLTDPAAQDNPLRGEGVNVTAQRQRDVFGFQFPGRVFRRQGFGALAPAFFDGRAAGQPLEAIPVKRTDALERVARSVVRQGQVTGFRVQQPVNQLTVHQEAAADARANGARYRTGSQPCAAPQRASPSAAPFTSVSKPIPARQTPRGTGPPGRRSSSRAWGWAEIRPKVWGSRARVERAEAGNADGRKRAVNRLLFLEKRQRARYRFFRRGGRKARFGAQVRLARLPTAHTNLVRRPRCRQTEGVRWMKQSWFS